MYEVLLDTGARKDLDALLGSLWQRVQEALLGLRTDPRPPGCVRLPAAGGAYRLRAGEYRVIYEVNDAERTVTVRRVRHRRDVHCTL